MPSSTRIGRALEQQGYGFTGTEVQDEKGNWVPLGQAVGKTPTTTRAAVDEIVGSTTVNAPVKVDKETEAAATQNEGILAKLSGQVTKFIHSVIKPNTASPATTPSKAPTSEPVPDAYRKGLGQDNSVSTELDLARSLGETAQDKPAYINVSSRIFQKAGLVEKVVDTYARFFLENVVPADQEKYQITETFTSFYAFFFGRRPRIYRFTGFLLNDENHRWLNDFLFYYENFFRGTKAAELDADVILSYEANVVSGAVLDFQCQVNAVNPRGVPFSMDILVLKHDYTQNFSLDMKDMIARRKQELEAVKAIIAEQLAMINRNIPATSQLAARFGLSSKTALSQVRLKGKNFKLGPPTQLSEANQALQKQLQITTASEGQA